jgi:glycolate oxidase FAD binding subunit
VRGARQQIGGDLAAPAFAESFWSALRHYQHTFFGADGLWRLSVPAATPPLDLPGEPLIDWGGALRWYADPPREFDVREIARAAQGTALRWRGAAPEGRFHPLPAVNARLHRRLKERFDPRGVFNPGRLVPGL